MTEHAAPHQLPDDLECFIRLFNERRYWESHEVLEGAWRRGGSTFFKALILLASAYVHAQRGNAHGMMAQADKTIAALAGYPDAYLGFDVSELLRYANEVREAARTEPALRGDELATIVAWPRLVCRLDRVSGTEPEMEA